MSALTDLDTQVSLAEKAVADLKMRAQALSSTDSTTGGTSTGGSVDSGVSTPDLGLGSGGPNPMNRDIVIDNINSELGISTSNVGVDTRLPQDPSDIKVGAPVDPLADVGPTTSNGTTLSDDTKTTAKASIMVEAPNTRMRNLLVFVVIALGAYMVFRKK